MYDGKNYTKILPETTKTSIALENCVLHTLSTFQHTD